jgi:hypothetical protein
MQTRELDTPSAGPFAWAAAQNARMRALAMWSHYTQAQKIRAERMKLALELCYHAKNIYINPREKFISIKIDKPRVRDSKNLALLEADYEKQGVKKITTDQGITYRIAKTK